MVRVIAFANQKGGVAKTTTTLNLGVAFKEQGMQVLCVDLDPQGNLTMSQGLNPDEIERSMFDVLVHKLPIERGDPEREVDLAVSSIDLAGAELALSSMIGRERALEKALAPVRDRYDYILIDTPPSLGLLTINAFVAADGVIVPVQCEYLSLRGLVQLENTLAMVRENLNPNVEIMGILPTMFDKRLLHSERGGRHPARELRRPRLQHEDPQDRPLRRGAGEGPVRARVRPDRRGGEDVPRPGEGGAQWRESARACVRARSRSSSARPRLRSSRPSARRRGRPRRRRLSEAPVEPPRGDGRARPDLRGARRRAARLPPVTLRRRVEPEPRRAPSPLAAPEPEPDAPSSSRRSRAARAAARARAAPPPRAARDAARTSP